MNTKSSIRVWLGRKAVRGALLLLIIIISVLLLTNSEKDSESEVENKSAPLVALTTPAAFSGTQELSLIGNVRAFTEARVTAERAGRVTAVNVGLGEVVSAGTVLATLENAAESAAVLQAEGVYDAAVAASAQSSIGVAEAHTRLLGAQNTAISTFESAFNTTNGVIVNSIDSFFSEPNSSVPGLRISGRGNTAFLNDERVAFQSILLDWQSRVSQISVDSNLETELAYADDQVGRVVVLVDTFLTVFTALENSNQYTNTELQEFSNTFTSLRATLIAVSREIDQSRSGLDGAYDDVRRAELAASGGTTSAADAQVKQALGSLQAARANLAKTILRTPIAGTVNSISVRTGDFINSFAPVAVVANNTALEIVTYISDTEKELLKVGDEVSIDDEYTGIVTEIAPAVDLETRKTEVRIATEGQGVSNGDTVRIKKQFVADTATITTIQIPITAIKFQRENGNVFVVEAGALVQRPIEIGTIFGNTVEVTSGLTATDAFVIDARGRVAGEQVEIIE